MQNRQIERRNPEQLKPHPSNARRHSRSQVEQLCGLILQYGWTQPIIIDETDTVLAGHGRLLAAKKLKLHDVPVIVVDGLGDAQKRAYVLADNKVALNSEWDSAALEVELSALKELQVDLPSIGFDFADTFSFGDAPASVAANVEQMNAVKEQRRKGNASVENRADTEHYIVLVYATRQAREAALERIGLPKDERYVIADAVEITSREEPPKPLNAKVADAKRSGTTG